MDPNALPGPFAEAMGPTDECWAWRRGGSGSGYGWWKGRYVHRVAYEILVGPIPAGHQIHHLCENRLCFNPGHLEPIAPRDHAERHKRRSTACPHGHPYPESLRADGRGCKVCNRIAQLERAGRQKAAKRSERETRNRMARELLAQGRPRREIAETLGVSVETIRRLELGLTKRCF